LAGAEHNVRRVTFENVSILDRPLSRDAPPVSIGRHVDDVRFSPAPRGGDGEGGWGRAKRCPIRIKLGVLRRTRIGSEPERLKYDSPGQRPG